jgi:mannitol/fructose-specific phosphotransferase system IIA component (Ntr-type)
MSLLQLVDPSLVFDAGEAGSRDAVLRSVAEGLERRGAIPSAAELLAGLLDREQQGSTAIGRGIAIPHCKLARLERPVIAVGVTPGGIALEAPDREPVRLFFLVVSPEASPAAHLQALAAISRWLKEDGNLDRIREARSAEELRACLLGERVASERG